MFIQQLLILLGRPILFVLKLPFRFHFSVKPVFFALFLISFSLFSFYYWILRDLPNPERLVTIPPKQTTQIFDRKGNLLYKIYDDENRTLVKLSDIPSTTRLATIAIEDKNFYLHQGFSLRGIFRAVERNLTSNQTQGGSTITQQLIKNTLLSREKSLIRKVKEIVLAVHTELLFSKDDILQMYLNQVPYGGTAYGIQAAAQQYFGKNANQLNLAQSALLAGLPQAPTHYSPFGENPTLAKSRQLAVLARMVEDNYITTDQAAQAAAENLHYISPSSTIKAPHFVMYVRDLLVNILGEETVVHGGLQVYTTLDLDLQQSAQKIINQELSKLQSYHVTNAAMLITRPSTGEILSMIGSKDYFDVSHDGQVNLTTSLRQPGSAIKPINYALAFEKGYTPSSVIDDSPISFAIPRSPVWTPQNYDHKFHGPVTLRTALASSYNIPAIKLLASNGISQMVNLAQKMGITTWTDLSRLGLSLTLGGAEVKMTDMAEVYGVFANQGKHVPLNAFLTVLDSRGQPISFLTNPLTPQEVISPQTAYLISDILSDNNARSPAFGNHSVLNLPGSQVAVKTGTSNDLRDNWTIGFTTDYLTAVWVGNNDNSPMSSIASGITGASPIWANTFSQLLSLQPHLAFDLPDNLVKVSICTLTNTLACPACPTIKTEIYIKGREPVKSCTSDQIAKVIQEKLKHQPSPTQGQILTGLTTSR